MSITDPGRGARLPGHIHPTLGIREPGKVRDLLTDQPFALFQARQQGKQGRWVPAPAAVKTKGNGHPQAPSSLLPTPGKAADGGCGLGLQSDKARLCL